MRNKANAQAKLKELQSNAQRQSFAVHLLLPGRTQSSPDNWPEDNLSATFDNTRF